MAKVSQHENAMRIYNELSELPGALEMAANHYGLARWYFKAQIANINTDPETLKKMVESMVYASNRFRERVISLDQEISEKALLQFP